MSTILYAAISRDGFIATPDDETPWSDDEWQAFRSFVLSCDYVIVGRRTYEIMRKNDELIDGPRYIVATSQADFDTDDAEARPITSARNMPLADKVGIIGGGELNGRLARLGLIDEMYLDIEPIELGDGIRLFGDHQPELSMQLIGSRTIGEATVQRHYRIVRNES